MSQELEIQLQLLANATNHEQASIHEDHIRRMMAELEQLIEEARKTGKIVFRRTLIGTGSLIEIPRKIAVCPYCDGQLTASITGCEQQEDGKWAATELQLDCEAEPVMDSDEWEEFIQAHSEMPYVYMLPVEERIKVWINRHFFFEVDEEKKE